MLPATIRRSLRAANVHVSPSCLRICRKNRVQLAVYTADVSADPGKGLVPEPRGVTQCRVSDASLGAGAAAKTCSTSTASNLYARLQKSQRTSTFPRSASNDL